VRRRGGAVLLILAAAALTAAPAAAQGAPEPPGPYVVDIHYATIGIPSGAALLPPDGAALVPARGRGFDIGAHVYAGRLGPSHLGFGVGIRRVRGNESGTQGSDVTLRSYLPQLSFNFGTRDGWSYLSTGVGVSDIAVEPTDATRARGESGPVLTINAGAGARWFMRRHLAVGFDLRLQRLSAGDAMPASMLFSLSAGISLR
jgi:hypothetical protein